MKTKNKTIRGGDEQQARRPSYVLFGGLQNSALLHSARPAKRKHVFKSEESRQRCISKLKPCKPGETRNPGGRPRTKPFHLAARAIAETHFKDLDLHPDDTVATAVMKTMAMRALSVSQTAVAAAKELADRAEGSPVQVHEHNEGGELSRGVEEVLVRFGLQFS